MLTRLHIQNFVIIDEQDILFSKGLNIITGETGAGKSIMLGALALVLGARAESKTLRDSSKKCIVEATFDQYPSQLDTILTEADVDISAELIMRREILASGKSRAFVNDTPVKLDFMKAVGHLMIDLHQQFQTLEIQNQAMQFKMLDAYSGLGTSLRNYRERFNKYNVLKERVNRLTEERSKSIQERDYIDFQLNEINEILPTEGDMAKWEEEFRLLENAESIGSIIFENVQALRDNDASIIQIVKDLSVRLRKEGRGVEQLEQIANRLDSTAVELEDLTIELSDLSEQIEPNQTRKDELESKIDGVQRLLMKHNLQSDTDLIAFGESLQAKIDGWQAVNDDLERATKERDYTEQEAKRAAMKISKTRIANSKNFAKEVNAMLAELEMKNARFKVEVNADTELTKFGINKVGYMFAANKGSKLEPVGKVASGGELSRLSLCVKSVVCKTMQLPTMVFDEIDTGVSGQVALKMGELLQGLAHEQQVIMITHSPQIAARATRHLQVSKRDNAESTTADISLLNPEERVDEIAKMLSGNPPTDAAVLNARELINQ